MRQLRNRLLSVDGGEARRRGLFFSPLCTLSGRVVASGELRVSRGPGKAARTQSGTFGTLRKHALRVIDFRYHANRCQLGPLMPISK